MATRALVEFVDDRPVRIFRDMRTAMASPAWGELRVQLCALARATYEIRLQIFQRAAGRCEDCGAILTSKTMHMHERVPRSEGGEVSLENSVALCFGCHVGRKDSAHGNRLPRFGEKSATETS